MTCGIYLITRKDTSQKYIGKSNNIEKRWVQHINGQDKGKSRIDNALVKHGADKFSFEVITELPNNDKVLREHERYWIKFYNSYEDKFHYNLTPGGEISPSSVPEIAKKISDALKGEKHPHYGKTGEDCFNWKDYGRIISHSYVNGRKRYGLKYCGKVIKTSYNPIALENWFLENYPLVLLKKFSK